MLAQSSLVLAIALLGFVAQAGGVMTPIEQALLRCDAAEVARQLEAGVDPNGVGSDDKSFLALAAGYCPGAIVDTLIRRGAEVNRPTRASAGRPAGRTPLMQVLETPRRREALAMLLDRGADPNLTDSDGDTALTLARENRLSAEAELLVARGAVAPTPAPRIQLTEAARRGDLPAIAALLRQGADPNARGRRGATPLGVAIEYGHAEAVDFLMDRGARYDPMAIHNYGKDALYLAITNRKIEVVRRLLVRGIDPNAPTASGVSPLSRAAELGQRDVVAILLEHRAALNVAGETGETPLTLAMTSRDSELVSFLRSKGARLPPIDPKAGRIVGSCGDHRLFSVGDAIWLGTSGWQRRAYVPVVSYNVSGVHWSPDCAFVAIGAHGGTHLNSFLVIDRSTGDEDREWEPMFRAALADDAAAWNAGERDAVVVRWHTKRELDFTAIGRQFRYRIRESVREVSPRAGTPRPR